MSANMIPVEVYKDGVLIETRYEPAPPPTENELLQAQLAEQSQAIDALLILLAQEP
jgi:hypothetical protein